MSREDVSLFYKKLETDIQLREKALGLKERYPDQEKLIEAFLALAKENGCEFTAQELVFHIYANGTETH